MVLHHAQSKGCLISTRLHRAQWPATDAGETRRCGCSAPGRRTEQKFRTWTKSGSMTVVTAIVTVVSGSEGCGNGRRNRLGEAAKPHLFGLEGLQTWAIGLKRKTECGSTANRGSNRVSNLKHSSDSSVSVCQDHQPQTTKIHKVTTKDPQRYNTAMKNGAAAFAMLTTRFRSDLGQGQHRAATSLTRLSMAQQGSAPCLRHLRASSVPAWQILWCFRMLLWLL